MWLKPWIRIRIRNQWMRIRNSENGPDWACSAWAAGQRRGHRPDVRWLEEGGGVHSGPAGASGRLLARRRVLQAPVCCGSRKWIRIRGSIPLTNGSGYCYFHQWLKVKDIIFFCSKFFWLLLLARRRVLQAAVLRIHEIFGVDPDPRIHTSDSWIRMRIRILLFLSVTFKTLTENSLFSEFFCLLHFEGAFT